VERFPIRTVTDPPQLDLEMAGIDGVGAFGAAWIIGVQRAEMLLRRRVKKVERALINFGADSTGRFRARSRAEQGRGQHTEQHLPNSEPGQAHEGLAENGS